MKKILFTLLLMPFLIFGQDSSNDILIINANNDAYNASSIGRIQNHLQGLLNATTDYSSSKVVLYGNSFNENKVEGPNGGEIYRSLLHAYYSAEHKSNLRAEINKGYKYVFIACDDVFANYETELYFEEIYQVSKDILNAGSIPVIFMNIIPTSSNNILEKVYRIVNGTGVEVVPVGGLFNALLPYQVPSLEGQSNAVSTYGKAAMVFNHITKANANTVAYTPTYPLYEDTYNSIDTATLVELGNAEEVANIATQTLVDLNTTTHYSGSFANKGAMVYRTIDISASPFNGIIPFLWRGTSTETGLSSRLKTIITQSLNSNPISKEVTFVNRFKKGWDPDVNVSNVAKNAFNTQPDRFPFMYVRAGTLNAQEVIDTHNQTNLLPLVIERPDYSYGANNSGSAQVVLNNCFKTYNYGQYSFSSYARLGKSYGWNIIPFCPAMARLIKKYPNLASTNDRVHTTDQLYYMQAAMILTSALGQDIPVPTAIEGKTGHIDAFNVGKEFTKQLAFLSETGEHIEQSDLSITTDEITDIFVDKNFSFQLEATGGDGNYRWELISSEALPEGISLSDDGVLFGTSSNIFENAILAVKVIDGNGAFRKAGFRFRAVELPECNSLANVALGKTASQSTTLNHRYNFDPSNAVDGNRNGNHKRNSITHTKNRNNSWWEVDLGQVYNLDFVKIWNRTNCCSERLTDFHVFVSDAPFDSKDLNNTINQAEVGDFHFPETAGRETDIVLNRTGRYLRIQLSGTNALQLAEVEVMGCDLSSLTNFRSSDKDVSNAVVNELNSDLQLDVNRVEVAPNPTSGNLFINLEGYMQTSVDYFISTSDGKQILQGKWDTNHSGRVELDLSQLQNGLYIIYMKPENQRAVAAKIVVSKNY